jgi:para-aminobenzoate synthetase component 1
VTEKNARPATLISPRGSAAPVLPLVVELTPAPAAWDVFQRCAGLNAPLFLDSALYHASLGRYSFVTADPFESVWSRGRRVSVSAEGRAREPGDPFAALAERLARYRGDPLPGLPPFQGGAAGLFGYDLCHHIERLPRPHFDEFRLPDLAVGLYDWAIAFDHRADRAWVISTGFPETEPRRREARARRRLRQVLRRLSRNGPRAARPAAAASAPSVRPALSYPVPGSLPGLASNFDRATYLDTIRRAIEYVHAGDSFQVNVAQRLLVPARLPPLELYRRLRECNPAPFAGYFDLGEFVIASASPERFLHVQDGAVETRPIKGTRPRGGTPAEDLARREELLHSAKDRAENIMIVDLLRNDLGRVCRYGSVRVPALCRVETYRTVHHLVSEVRGRLREGLGPIDLLRAAFPGGSVTGAPKVRAMEIIAELEPTARGAYCGSLGYIGFDGSMDTNILIRTCTAAAGWVQFPVGGGIVADSVPEREYEETWHKAEGLLRALR